LGNEVRTARVTDSRTGITRISLGTHRGMEAERQSAVTGGHCPK